MSSGAIDYQTWGALPTSPNNGDIVYFTDIPFSLIYDSANSAIIWLQNRIWTRISSPLWIFTA